MSFALSEVSVRYAASAQRASLSGISLAAQPGEQIALIGPSGAGKTTLLQVLACGIAPTEGKLELFGQQPWSMPDAGRHAMRRRLFLAPQTPPLPPRQRVVTAVLAGMLPQWSIGRALRSLFAPVAAERAFEALSRFDLGDKLYLRVDRLSGGERQRCSLARLLVSEAGLLLVDEPLSALDPVLAERTLAVLQQEARDRRATLACSLHQVDLALARFPRIVGLRDGRIMFDLPREAVTDDMIAKLYRDAGAPGGQADMDAPAEPGQPARQPLAARCF
ncbi:phosphonate ABC transporter ATP-binding protein [Noviherbaspirillum galbum]|uniref:ATP-binding cassette domain-containing protein n=1 Tax=Noviherbaspirillum galbum TaxID=2709383 RepID=A0A6B3SZG2_9BURK|nr:ATP-binding cassette domain-containing protein [Noviherbaspirillum galbum]NEX64069.1 ATP-binding cassette domain-containing protein [Noviherbaspirillum galbum]